MTDTENIYKILMEHAGLAVMVFEIEKPDRGTELATSRAGHEKSCLNMGGPSSKAKYS